MPPKKKLKVFKPRRRVPKRARKQRHQERCPQSLYHTPRYQRWRNRVFARDRYTCRLCGATGVYLEAHHILRKADFPELTFRVSNGITLCKDCHETVTGREYEYAGIFRNLLKKHYPIGKPLEHVEMPV